MKQKLQTWKKKGIKIKGVSICSYTSGDYVPNLCFTDQGDSAANKGWCACHGGRILPSVINDVWWWLSFLERPVTRFFYFILHTFKNNVCIKVRVPRHTAAAVHWYIPGHDGLKKHFSRLHSALHCTTYRMQPTTLLVLPLKLGPSLPLLSPLLVLALHFEAVRVPASMHTMHNVQQLGVTVLIKINT